MEPCLFWMRVKRLSFIGFHIRKYSKAMISLNLLMLLNSLLFFKIPIAKVVNVEVIITILDERRKHVTQNLVKSKNTN